MKTVISAIALVVLVLGMAPFAMATPVDSNSITQDGIEYYVQTDKSTYDLGENVEMLFRVTNLTDADVLIGCSRHGEFNLLVEKNGEAVWYLAHAFAWFSPGVELSDGESKNIPYIWNMIGDNNNLVAPGIYDVVGVMYNEPWTGTGPTEVSVPITIVPEPGSLALLLFGAGLFGLLVRNRTMAKKYPRISWSQRERNSMKNGFIRLGEAGKFLTKPGQRQNFLGAQQSYSK